MTPTQAIRSCILRSFSYRGRAPRSEFWWFAAFNLLVALLALAADGPLPTPGQAPPGPRWASAVTTLLLLAPNVSVAVRRLHDMGQTGRWLWFLPLPTALAMVYAIVAAIAGIDQSTAASALAISALTTPLLSLALFVAAAFPGTRGPNAYGPGPEPSEGFGVPEGFRFRP